MFARKRNSKHFQDVSKAVISLIKGKKAREAMPGKSLNSSPSEPMAAMIDDDLAPLGQQHPSRPLGSQN